MGRGFFVLGCAIAIFVVPLSAAAPQATLTDNWLPHSENADWVYQWSDSDYSSSPTKDQSASVSVKSVSGPINVVGAYGFTLRLDGVTCLWGRTKAATLAQLPKLGPSALPATKRRHFFTPFDLMTFGFNPLIPAYPDAQSWGNTGTGRDFSIYGVTGTTKVLGVQSVTVPAGTYKALAVRTEMTQKGFPFGSGTRTIWLAPVVGLVKLVFQHDDDSVSTVELTKTSGANN